MTTLKRTPSDRDHGVSLAGLTVRERLLEAAEALVYAGGIHATGVDAIVQQSSTTRKSF